MKLKINGQPRDVEPLDPATPLLWVLRDELKLTGTKFGCGVGQCGACTVHINGKAVRSCLTPISSLGDADITTIEGLAGPVTGAVQLAWEALDVPQCGYCQSGQIMSAVALLTENSSPNNDEVDSAMKGNICRCATYQRIRTAIHQAANELEG